MSYKNEKSYITRFIELSMSSNQSVTSTSATLVEFNTLRGDVGHGVSLGSGTITLSADRYYYVFGSATMDKDTTTDQYNARWYYTDGSQIPHAEGAFRSYKSYQSGSDRWAQALYCQLIVNPSTNTDYQLKVDNETGILLKDGTRLFIIEMSKQ